jgi:hypothetical protein
MRLFEEIRRLIAVATWELTCLVKGHRWVEVADSVAVIEIEMAPGEGYPATLGVYITTYTCPECGGFETHHRLSGDPAEGWGELS